MIVDKASRMEAYRGLCEGLDKAFSFLASDVAPLLAEGRHEIDGGALFAIISTSQTIPKDAEPYEVHRNYLDVHMVLEGEEWMGYAPRETLHEVRAYDPKEDCALLEGDGSWIRVTPGMFVVFGPNDAHQPSVALKEPNRVRKIVVKVKASGKEGS